MAITQNITIPNEPPSSRDRVNFRLRADAFVAWMKTFATQIANLITQINSTETSVNAKEASATSAASTATTQAGIATTKAGEALESAPAAHNAQLAAEAVFDSFDDKYLGAKAAAPTTDNDGNALTTGALFFKTTAPKGIYVYDAELSAWSIFSFIPTSHGSLSGRSDADVHPISSITGVSAFARTLLDDTSAEAARTTLGAAPTVSPTFSGTATLPSTTSIGNVSATEITYLDGVTSNIQTQLAAKQASLGFTPVRQGGGIGQTTSNIVYLGWTNANRLAATVDSKNLGNIVFDSDLQQYVAGAALPRAHVCCNGTTGAIYSGKNVVSVTDNGVSDFTVNFIVDLPTEHYAVCGSVSGNSTRSPVIAAPSAAGTPYAKTTKSCRFLFGGTDAAIFTAAFIC